ncbi:Hypothetical predicted protein [Mytilus galloprovincialis]|uniref:C1q domain-containing protein n=1 Tax=Mytilus galloprovincialis TaxID=29158 RepID=A0A8B6FL63_MYTGA|nr:Hypothetical predicted protein [Mytilus galloprovincialis]
MEKKINKEEVIPNIVERLRMVEKLVKEALILNTAGSVAFSASLSDDSHVDADEVIKFDTVWVNIGNGYDPDSGVFTAPKSGLYLISNTIRASANQNDVCILKTNEDRENKMVLVRSTNYD